MSYSTTRIIYTLATIAIVFVVAATSFFMLVDYNNRMALAKQQTHHAAVLYHDNTHLVMGSVDSILNALENVLALNPTEQELHRFLEEATAPFPMLRTVLVLNSDGIVIGDTRTPDSLLGFDLSDTPYFRAYQNHETDGLFVDNPLQSRLDGQWVIPIALGLYDDTQTLQWVVVASIASTYLSTFEFSSSDNSGLTGYIVTHEGRILANIPYTETEINKPLDTLIDIPQLDSAVQSHVHTTSAQIEHNDYLIEYQAVEPYGITVVFLQDKSVILEPYYREAFVLMLFAGLLITGVCLITYQQIRLTNALNLQTAARQQSEGDYRRIVEAANEGIWQMDAAARVVFVNQRLADMLGYSIEELIGKPLRELLFEDDYPILEERLRQLQRGMPQNRETRYRHKNGSELWVILSSNPIFDSEGVYRGAFAMVTDITGRKRTEQKLQAIFDATSDALLLVNDRREYVDVNPAACAMLGYSREELLRLTVSDITGSDDVGHLAAWSQFQHQQNWEGLYALRRKDGSIIVTEGQAIANILPGLHLSVCRDVTERYEMELALRESEARFRNLADSTPLFIWLVEPDKSLSYINKAWLEFTGQTWDEGTGHGWLDVLHPEDKDWMAVTFPQEIRRQKPFEVEARFRRHDGEYRWILMKGIPRRAPDGTFEGYAGSSMDITDQQRFAEELALQIQIATAELRESENRYRTLADMSNAYSYSYRILPDRTIDFEWVTDGFTRMSGYTVDDIKILGMDYVFAEDRERMVAFRQYMFDNPIQETIEYRMVCKTGEIKHMLAHIKSEWDENEQRVVRVIGTVQDVSRQKMAENALRVERNFLQSVMDTTPNGIVVFDTQRHITFANTHAEEMLQLEHRATKTHPHRFPEWEIHDAEDQPIPLEKRPFAEIMQTKKPSYGHEQVLVADDGQRTSIIVNAAPLLNESGEVEQVVFVFEDISELKQVEAELRNERNFLQSIMNATPSGIVALDIHSKITFANAQGEKMLGIKRDATGQIIPIANWDATFINRQPIPDEQRLSVLVKATKKPVFGVEQLIIRADGQQIPIRCNAVPQLDSEGNVTQIVYSFEDISLHLKSQKQIEEALRQEKELNDIKNRFVTLISHELRTPLSIIMTSAELLQMYYDKISPEQILFRTDKIQKQVMRLKRIMEDVSFINKTDMMGHQVQLTVIDLPAFCENIIESVLLAEENQPEIIRHYEGAVTDIVGDETLLYQIMVNLVSNAVKYTANDGTVTVLTDVSNATIKLQVTDTGIGIPEADQHKLFQSFHRASNVGNISGTGLGLDIIRRAVKVLEGNISLTSIEGKGTTFTVTLPNLAQKD